MRDWSGRRLIEREGASRGMRSGVEPRVGGGVAILDDLDGDGEGEGEEDGEREGEEDEEEDDWCLRQPRMMKEGGRGSKECRTGRTGAGPT